MNAYKPITSGVLLLCVLFFSGAAQAADVYGDPSDYTQKLSGLAPGDTLHLEAGTYTDLLVIQDLNGEAGSWITITGPTSGDPAVFVADPGPCCNTVEIRDSSYVAIKNLTIDGNHVDGAFGLSAKDGSSNRVHHIRVEGCTFINHDTSQGNVAISTKTPTWDWAIRGNKILGAGTGLYLGNSNGAEPFVRGLLEHNLISDTIGYNIQIKWQSSRPDVEGIPQGPSRTIIRHNVFIKTDRVSPSGDRPNLLVGGFPESGAGAQDLYEIYGNFFFHNPRESLFQGSGRISIHDNVFADVAGTAIALQNHDLPLRLAHVYNNTVYAAGTGISVSGDMDQGVWVVGNLLFADTGVGGSPTQQVDNLVDSVENADLYVANPTLVLGDMDLYPLPSECQGSALDLSPFSGDTDYDKDFNGATKGAFLFRGAYAGDGVNPGWTLDEALKPGLTDAGVSHYDAIPLCDVVIGDSQPNPQHDASVAGDGGASSDGGPAGGGSDGGCSCRQAPDAAGPHQGPFIFVLLGLFSVVVLTSVKRGRGRSRSRGPLPPCHRRRDAWTLPSHLASFFFALALLSGCGDDTGGGNQVDPGPGCTNDICDENESCESCPQDCGECPRCGDGICNGGDTCANCERDCGECCSQDDGRPIDTIEGASAAFSLRRLSSDYNGPVLQVRRDSDDATRDIGFTSSGSLDLGSLRSFVGEGSGWMTVFYNQVEGEPNLTQADPELQPLLVEDGEVITAAGGAPALLFDGSDEDDGPADHLSSDELSTAIILNDYTLLAVLGEETNSRASSETVFAGVYGDDHRVHGGAALRGSQTYINTAGVRFGDAAGAAKMTRFGFFCLQNSGDEAALWQGNTIKAECALADRPDLDEPTSQNRVHLGGGFQGAAMELVVFPRSLSKEEVEEWYRKTAEAWAVGPACWNEGALLPQERHFQVVLYDWLESLNPQDLTLPAETLSWDETLTDTEELADLWLQLEGATASRVVRGEPEWYVLDAGDGRGIEATGEVRIWHEPGSGYGGNPARSWSNEPAYLYQLHLPTGDGGEGNPYRGLSALGYRGLVVAAVDMMMYHRGMSEGGFYTWQDMYGKALLGWAETYRWCKELLPEPIQAAFEVGFMDFLDQMIATGPRAVNTNMDMFSLHAAGDLYAAANHPLVKSKSLQAVKRALFGYPDGQLETKHQVFKTQGWEFGVFDPSGFIMEGDQPDVFYGGESIYHIAGALAAVMDRDTGAVPESWQFLVEVMERLDEWREYQRFFDPGRWTGDDAHDDTHIPVAGSGFCGRTGAAVPAAQSDEIWTHATLIDLSPVSHPRARRGSGGPRFPAIEDMRDDINQTLNELSSELASPQEGEPPVWSGWSPWTKKTPYLPAKGWYGRLNRLIQEDSPTTYPPIERQGVTYSKAFGGDPVGQQYWAFKAASQDRGWGFFLEAQAHQGSYGGWYGGKVESFWTSTTGVVLVNRHGKTGCDGNTEDSTCWDNLDYKAAHHVWGRDENGGGFTTLLLRGRELARQAHFDLEASQPTVTINNVFNDPSHSDPTSKMTGEQSGAELEGAFEVTNTFTAMEAGLRVTHEIVSDGSDEITELWATLPVFLRAYSSLRPGDQPQIGLDDTRIEYWGHGSSSWQPLPEDTSGDSVPERVDTDALRLGRDYLLGDGPQYVYVALNESRGVRLSTQIYEDPYQTKTSVRAVHIDLHGDPGSSQPTPTTETVTYEITLTSPHSP